MANLKQDILNNLGNDKYYIELDLVRQAQDPNLNYRDKVEDMSSILKNIATIDLATQLVSKYFPDQQEQAPSSAPQPNQQQQAHVHPGQSHGE